MTAYGPRSNPVQRLFDWKVRGIRWIEIIGGVCVAAMVFSVYVAKTAAARESTEIGRLEDEISETRQRVRLLRAEISRLEQPSRLEALSHAAGLAPVDVHRQASESQLTSLKPAVVPPAAVTAPVVEEAVPVVPSVPRETDEVAQ
ncbi:cell division protein [Brevundimonas sp.]|uniref:cell division protein FtsL n=1 Tax=Brevundimonas sp. TaxID=1871086 RepID=UPI001A2BE4AA|nr:cell division protein [Brevundimonas sp.]MBJ7483713.1 cell division protein [Brevundimonas sp.]